MGIKTGAPRRAFLSGSTKPLKTRKLRNSVRVSGVDSGNPLPGLSARLCDLQLAAIDPVLQFPIRKKRQTTAPRLPAASWP